MQVIKNMINESQIKIEYLNWKLEHQDKICSTDTLWPFSDNENVNKTYISNKLHIFNTKGFINQKYIKLHKIGDTAYCKMLHLLDHCEPVFNQEIKNIFSLNNMDIYGSSWKNHTGVVSLLNNLRQYMATELSISSLTLINERFFVKEIGKRIEYFPVFDEQYSIKPEIRIIPAFVLLFTSNLSSLFIKYNKIEYKSLYWSNFYFLTHARIF